MRIYPAIDLRGGRVVQLVGGEPEAERIHLADPLAVARRWLQAGFTGLHLVDLDAALGDGSNRELVEKLLAEVEAEMQVGGGIRDEGDVSRLLGAGAARVILGTRAVADPGWLAELAHEHPGRLVAAADIRDGRVLTHGWRRASEVSAEEHLERLDSLPLAGVLVTDVAREGRAEGVAAHRFADLARLSDLPLLAAGGIAGLDDLRALRDAGVAGAVIGMALYTGALDAGAVAREFSP